MTKARDLANSAAAFASVSATELGYVDGVTSAIQTQMDAKAPSSTAVTLTGTQTLTNKTLTSPVIASVVNNTLTSTTGDIIYASAANTPARLGIGTTGQVLNVASGIPAWATPALSTSGLTLISRQTFTSVATTGTTFDGVFTSTYKNYLAIIETCFAATATDDFQLQLRYAGPTTQATDYLGASQQLTPAAAGPITGSNTATQMTLATNMGSSAAASGSGQISFGLVGNSSQSSIFWGQYVDKDGNYYDFGGKQDIARTYTGFLLKSSSSNITGTVAVYGLAIA